MKQFLSFFKFEWRRLIKWWNLVILATFFLVALIFTQVGIGQYNSSMKHKDKFLELERKKIEQYINYRVFGLYGFQMMAMPVPISIFFSSSSPFPEMTAVINTGPSLSIFSTLQAGSVFKIKRQTFSDLSGVFLLFGSLIFFLYGFETFMNKPLAKVMSSVAGAKKVFIHTVLSRLLLITIYCSLVLVFSYLLVLINGVFYPFHWGLLIFLVEVLLCSFFFFSLGVFLGTIRPLIVGLGIGIASVFFLVHVVPAVIDTIISYNANTINSVYETELKKWIIQSDFEKQVIKKYGTLKIGDIASKERMDEWKAFLNNEYKQIQSMDNILIEQMSKNLALGQWLSILFPTSQYSAVNSELSGKGYATLLELTRYAQKVKHKFVLKYLDVIIFSGNPNEMVKPFLDENENLFKSRINLILNILWGILATILYTFIFHGLAFRRQRKNLFSVPDKKEKLVEGGDVEIESGQMSEFLVSDDLFDNQIYCYLSGEGRSMKEKGFKLKVTLDGKELSEDSEKSNFLYLCGLQYLPYYLDTADLVSFFMQSSGTKDDEKKKIIEETGIEPLMHRRLGKLNTIEKTMAIIALLRVSDQKVLLLNRMEESVPFETALKLKSLLDEIMSKRNAAILFLISDRITFFNCSDQNSYFSENDVWSNAIVETVKRRARNEEKE